MKTLGKIVGWGLIAYVAFFLFWFLLISSCMETQNSCGGDTMPFVAQHLYGWVFHL